MGDLSILLFGRYAERYGREHTASGDGDQSCVAEFVRQAFPEDETRRDLLSPRTIFVLDRVTVGPDTPVGAARELALLPPVSGG